MIKLIYYLLFRILSKRQVPTDFDWKIYINFHEDLHLLGIKKHWQAEYHWLRYGYKEKRIYSTNSLQKQSINSITNFQTLNFESLLLNNHKTYSFDNKHNTFINTDIFPCIIALIWVKTDNIKSIKEILDQQTYKATKIIYIGSDCISETEIDLYHNTTELKLFIHDLLNIRYDYVAFMSSSDYYGAHYFEDCLSTISQNDADIIGKSNYYIWSEYTSEIIVKQASNNQKNTAEINQYTAFIRKKVIDTIQYTQEISYNFFSYFLQKCKTESITFTNAPINQYISNESNSYIKLDSIIPKNNFELSGRELLNNIFFTKQQQSKLKIIQEINSIKILSNVFFLPQNTNTHNKYINYTNHDIIIKGDYNYVVIFEGIINIKFSLNILIFSENTFLNLISSDTKFNDNQLNVHFKTPHQARYLRLQLNIIGIGYVSIKSIKLYETNLCENDLERKIQTKELQESSVIYKFNQTFFQKLSFELFENQLKNHIKNISKLPEQTPFVFIFSGTIYIQEERANRPIRFTNILLEKNIPVLFSYFRWKSTDSIPSNYHPLLFQIPIDFTYRLLDYLSNMDLGNRKKIFMLSFPHSDIGRWINIFKIKGWQTMYDARDDWEEFSKVGMAKWYNLYVEKYAVANCDFTTAISTPLQNKLQEWTTSKTVHLCPNAFDSNFLQSIPLRNNAQKIAGYFGHLTEKWFDWDAFIQIAKNKTDWRFEIIGHQEPSNLQLPSNVYLFGKKNHTQINEISKKWSVAFIPFKINKLSEAVDPIKIYEYLALHLPTVSFIMPQIHNYPYTFIATTINDFESQLENAHNCPIDKKVIDKFLANNTWEQRIEFIMNLTSIESKHGIIDNFLKNQFNCYNP